MRIVEFPDEFFAKNFWFGNVEEMICQAIGQFTTHKAADSVETYPQAMV
jgi:hypothetical protein